jgi:hypothetical protein
MRRNGIHSHATRSIRYDQLGGVGRADAGGREQFSIKVGAKSASGRALAGCRIEVSVQERWWQLRSLAKLCGLKRGAVLDHARHELRPGNNFPNCALCGTR